AAYDDFRQALGLNAHNAPALRGISLAAAGAQRHDDLLAYLRTLAAADPANGAARIELSRVLASGGDFDGAIAAATDAMRQAPNDPEPAEQLASIYADAGDADRLEPLADALAARFP